MILTSLYTKNNEMEVFEALERVDLCKMSHCRYDFTQISWKT